MESEQVADFHRDWVTGQAEREAMATKCREAYFECETNQIPEFKCRNFNKYSRLITEVMMSPTGGTDASNLSSYGRPATMITTSKIVSASRRS